MGNPNEFDQFVNELQNNINLKDKNDFSVYALDLGKNPRYIGVLPPSEISVKQAWRGSCGDAVTFYLHIKEDQIRNLSFESDGCITSVMAASQTAILAIHKPLAAAKALDEAQVVAALGKFPSESFHCATLAITALHQAIDKYLAFGNSPETSKTH